MKSIADFKGTPGEFKITGVCSDIVITMGDSVSKFKIVFAGPNYELDHEEAMANARLFCNSKKMLGILNKISHWDLPAIGELSYEAKYGINGSRDYFKKMAQDIIDEII